jgi:hypothetical protein
MLQRVWAGWGQRSGAVKCSHMMLHGAGTATFGQTVHHPLCVSLPTSVCTGEDLRHALDCALAKRPLERKVKNSIGCNIKWHPGKAPAWFHG